MPRAILLALAALALVACGHPSPPAAPAPAPAAVAPAPALSRAEKAALKTAGMTAYYAKDWTTCAENLDRAGDHYDAACCYAQAGDADHAFALLERAFDARFRQLEHLKMDPDLAPLHADARWQPAVDGLAKRLEAYRATVNAELLQLYTDDQADRTGTHESIDWKVVGPRDQARRVRVDAIVAAGGAVVSDDYYHAAMVYQHGETVDDIRRANELARKAVEIDPANDDARWLVAASEDRVLVREGKPQKWATQFGRKNDGPWVLEPVDPSITDEQRAEMNVPPLAEAQARAAEMNKQLESAKQAPATKSP